MDKVLYMRDSGSVVAGDDKKALLLKCMVQL